MLWKLPGGRGGSLEHSGELLRMPELAFSVTSEAGPVENIGFSQWQRSCEVGGKRWVLLQLPTLVFPDDRLYPILLIVSVVFRCTNGWTGALEEIDVPSPPFGQLHCQSTPSCPSSDCSFPLCLCACPGTSSPFSETDSLRQPSPSQAGYK